MQLGMDMSAEQVQKLILTPQVEFSLTILKMSTEELNHVIEEEIIVNPLLTYTEQENTDKKTRECRINYRYGNADRNRRQTDRDEEEYINAIPDNKSYDTSLKKYLQLQLHTQPHIGKDSRIAEFLIECLEENGYLRYSSKEIASALNIEETYTEQIIKKLQDFEPAGVFARSVKECLLLQIARQPVKDPDVILLITNYLQDVADNKIPKICRETGFEKEYVLKLIKSIRQLNPYPGNSFCEELNNRYLYPDITIRQDKAAFIICFNRERICEPQLNSEYIVLMNRKEIGMEDKSYMQEHYNEAKLLLRCIKQREDTMKKVMEAIVRRQRTFFEKGKMYLSPLTLSDIADEIEMHESTVSRAVRNKYVECKWGVFELKYFFSNKSPVASDSNVSVTNVHMAVKEMIKNEDKKNPLSDSRIVACLQEQGITISRRAVAKYRGQMSIPNAGLRKEYDLCE